MKPLHRPIHKSSPFSRTPFKPSKLKTPASPYNKPLHNTHKSEAETALVSRRPTLQSIDKIVVLDFGGQYAHLIANRIRRLGVFSEIRPAETPASELAHYKGIILSGGPGSVYAKGAPMCDTKILNLGLPILGICYGHQLLIHLLGGAVEPEKSTEYGKTQLHIVRNVGPLKFLGDMETVWMSHGDTVTRLPAGMERIAYTDTCEYAAIADEYRKFFGVQFHPEVTHTEQGVKMLENFVELTRAEKEWNLKDYVENLYDDIRKQARSRKVFCLVSGGVDSTVAFTLLEKALSPQRVHGFFVDTGLLRSSEAENVKNAFKKMGLKVHFHDAKSEFFKALAGVTAPEEKRKIIGDTFLQIQRKISKELKLNPQEWMLGQGTIYPDTIESGGTQHASKIKTHHNRVPQIEALMKKGLLIEPLKELYKDEVRSVGERLGIAKEFVWRHPFPGPGLAVRCLCAKKPVLPRNVSDVEKKLKKFLSPHGLSARLLPVQSVGVQGDDRTYKNPFVLSGEASWETLALCGTQIINSFREVNRVVYSVYPSTVQKIDFQKTSLTLQRITLLQQVDDLVMRFVEQKKISRDIWQFPVILIPVSINGKPGETVVLRPVCSEEAMTASPYFLEWSLLRKLSEEIMKISGVSAVLYDVTSKPPGTIEWE